MKNIENSDRTVYFYLPYQQDGVEEIPDKIQDYWAWISRNRRIGEGKYSWTLQSYLYLKEAGMPCRIVHRFPNKGIVISHRDFLPILILPRAGVFLVCIKPDRKAHTWAHFYIIQNKNDQILTGFNKDRTREISFWPQPSLIPRRADRGGKCENIRYLGRMVNLAKELRTDDWRTKLNELRFDWRIVPLERWNDYQDIDLTVSVREFGGKSKPEDPVLDPDSKPPSKLVNSWLAGVPAIVGKESAYRNIRESALDYIEVETVDELTESLKEIRRDKELYNRMVAHGLKRSREFSARAILDRWEMVIQEDLIARYGEWRKLSSVRRSYLNMVNVIRYFASKRNWMDLKAILAGKTLRGY